MNPKSETTDRQIDSRSDLDPKDRAKDAPFIGPHPFESRDRRFFFGRDREARDLCSLVTAHAATLLYAPSGAGKTSLLNAGLIPILGENDFEILPVVRVAGARPDKLVEAQISNLYMYNVLTRLNDALNLSTSSTKYEPGQLYQTNLGDFLNEVPRQKDQFGEPRTRVLLFDQLEELFTHFPDLWPKRADFFEQVASALEKDRLLRVVLGIREDYLARLDPYASLLPEKLRTRFRLELLREDAAHLAVTEPLRFVGRSFEDGVADTLVRELLKVRDATAGTEANEVIGEFVEGVQLQVVCQELWSRIDTDKTVTAKHIEGLDVDAAIARFYDKTVADTTARSTVREEDLRAWFDKHLISDLGTRGMVIRGRQDTQGMPHSAVDLLVEQHLLRAEMRSGAVWFELSHDGFIDPIRTSNARFREDRQIHEALKPYHEMIAANPRAKDAYLSAGKALITYSRFEEAVKNYDRAIQQLPNDAELYLLRADAYSSLARTKDAIADCDRAISIDPINPKGYWARARLYWIQANVELALRDYAKVIKLAPLERANLHADLLNIGRKASYDWAMKAFDLALGNDANRGELLYERADRRMEQKEYELAIQDYAAAGALNYSAKSAQANRARCLRYLDRFSESLALLEDILKKDPQYIWAHNESATVLLAQGEYEKTIEACNKALALNPSYHWSLYTKGDALRRLLKLPESITALSEAISIDPKFVAALNLRGLSHGDLGHDMQAVADFDTVVMLDPKHQWAWVNKAEVLGYMKRFPEALAATDRAIEIDSSYSYAYQLRAEIHEKMGDYPRMLEDCELAIKSDPNDSWYYSRKGSALFGLGRIPESTVAQEKAIEIVFQAIEKQPEYYANYGNLAWYYHLLRKTDDAVKYCQKSISLKPEEPVVYLNLGLIYFRVGQLEAAHAAMDGGIARSKGMSVHRFDDVIDELETMARKDSSLSESSKDLVRKLTTAKSAVL